MASEQRFMDYVIDQIGAAGPVSCRKMFGEYAVYCDGKVVALVCDNQFFLKPTIAGRALLEVVHEAAPYPGAKAYLRLDDQLDNQALMARLVRATADALPTAKPAKPAKPRAPTRNNRSA